MNGVLVDATSKSDSDFPSEGNVTIGAFMWDNLFAHADFAEIIIYDRALGAEDLEIVRNYLGGKYSLLP